MKKNIKLITLSSLLLIFNLSFGQGFWAKQIGGILADKGEEVVVDAAGNIYSTGTFSGTCDFDPSIASFTMVSSGNTDVYISKLDPSGNFIWAKKIGGSQLDNVSDIKIDATGNIYFVGSFSSICDFDPGAGTFNMTSPGTTSDAYVCKLDMNGNFIWARQMGSPWWDGANTISIDAAGNIVIGGDFSTTSAGPADMDPGPGTFTFTTGTSGGNTDIFILKLTPAGNFVWAKQIGGPSGDFPNSIKTDNLNNIYVGGYFSGTTDFDPNAGITNLISLGFEDIYILKLDASGNFSWARNMGSSTVDYCKSIAVDPLGNVYSTGSFRSVADFDPGAGTYTLAAVAGDDIFVSKLDNSGNFVWAKSFGSTSADAGNAIATDGSGNVFTTGVFRLSMDVDPGFGSHTLSSIGNADCYIQKLDANGNFLWAGQMGGIADEFGMGMYIDASGIVYTTGYFSAVGDFDPTTSSINLTAVGQSDAYVQRFCQPASQPGFIAGNNTYCGNGVYSYSVATVIGASSYSWSLPSGWAGGSTTNSISVTTLGSGSISVTAINSCAAGVPRTYSITINPLPTVTATTSNSLICSGQSATLSAGGANLYVWSPSGSGNSIIVSPTTTTTYSVTGLDVNGCQNTAMITQSVSACAGINSLNFTDQISIYPNPTNGIIQIELNGKEMQFEIINALGQKIMSSAGEENATFTIDLKDYHSGVYFIILQNNNSRIIRKIVKE